MQSFSKVLRSTETFGNLSQRGPLEAEVIAGADRVTRSRAVAMTGAAARMVSVRIPDSNRPPALRLADSVVDIVDPRSGAAPAPQTRSRETSLRETSSRPAESRPTESHTTASMQIASSAGAEVGESGITNRRGTAAARKGSGKRQIRGVSGFAGSAVPAAGPISLLARSQLADAHRGLDRSMQSQDAADRYAAAHLGALRGAAALLATRPKPLSRNLKHASVWVLMTKVAPEMQDWANYFAAGSAKRKAAEAGISRLISEQDAEEMVRQAADFLELVEQMIQL